MNPSFFDNADSSAEFSPASVPAIPRFSVSDFLSVVNDTLSYTLSPVEVEGEISSFKTSKGKWVFFDLKDSVSTISCFMTIFQLRVALEDGMKVVVRGTPKLTSFGRFSLTVQTVQPVGEGSLKKSFELLKEKLSKEGLFAPEKKRPLPENPTRLGVITSATSAGFADFKKILGARWGGLTLKVANVGVQGASAADEIIRAFDYFNELGDSDVLVLIRGGGSKDDLSVFNDEPLVRKIAASKIPVLTGIGHEVDESLADLAADVRASTPSNAAELLTRDKSAELRRLHDNLRSLKTYLDSFIDNQASTNLALLKNTKHELDSKISLELSRLSEKRLILDSLNPASVLEKGYAILSGKISPGELLTITTKENLITSRIEHVKSRTKA